MIDRSAKILYGTNKVGKRFRKLLDDKQGLILWMLFEGHLSAHSAHINFISVSGTRATLSEVIYSPLRNVLVHEGRLPENIRITSDATIGYKEDVFILSRAIIIALLLMLISLPFNARFKEFKTFILQFQSGLTLDLSDVWGNEHLLIAKLEKLFGMDYKPPPPHEHTSPAP